MEAFAISTLVVAIAEVGDKTQLLSLLLVARFSRPWPIVAGIAVATVFNHFLAGFAGDVISRLVGPEILRYGLAASFVLMGLWLLRPDQVDEAEGQRRYGGVFLTSLVLFFLAEMGDKTQIATAALGARYDPLWAVVVGTTLGMLIANVPVVFGGEWLMQRVPVKWVQRVAAVLFIGLGGWTLLSG